MARRSDHTREELKGMAIVAGQKIMASEGLSKFSSRAVAREIGYTVGTLYNVFEGYDDIILHINAATLDDMREYIATRTKGDLQGNGQKNGQDMPSSSYPPCSSSHSCEESIRNLAAQYIQFATENYALWSALFEFSLPQETPLPDWYAIKMKTLFTLVEEPFIPLFGEDTKKAEHTAKVLWAGIHGICHLGLSGKLDAVGAESVQVLADSLIEYFMRGLES